MLALSGTALVGCTPEAEPSPTPTAAFASEEEAFAAAEETYRGYIAAFNNVDLQDPRTFEPVFDFTTGDYQSTEREQLSEMNAEGYIRGGAIEVVSFEGLETTSTTISARTCEDVSSTTFTDKSGVSLVPPDRANHVAQDVVFTVVDGRPLLSSAMSIEDASCVTG
ncbi:hypothetical protein MHM582_3555 [Microbacterium sp. HM58-2]|nr:hypothetical protein MHM582_3555 [Microbacterium sp. HM58-2]